MEARQSFPAPLSSPFFSPSVCSCISVAPSHAREHIPTYTHTNTLILTHTHANKLSHSLTLTYKYSLTQTNSHTHTHSIKKRLARRLTSMQANGGAASVGVVLEVKVGRMGQVVSPPPQLPPLPSLPSSPLFPLFPSSLSCRLELWFVFLSSFLFVFLFLSSCRSVFFYLYLS